MGAPVILDISRTLSRIGHGGQTGIDRVEAAYLAEIRRRDDTLFLARITRGIALIDRRGLDRVLSAQDGNALPPPDTLARLSRGLSPARRGAETLVREVALGWDWVLPGARMKTFAERLPGGAIYLNVGHSNLDPRLLGRVPGLKAVLVHDLIPLDHPEFTRRDIPAKFERRMRAVAAHADLVICNSAHTEARCRHWFGGWGRVPDLVTIPLGIPPRQPVDRNPAPNGAFAIIGTVEPRKNHAMLLDIWSHFHRALSPQATPRLHIIGQRGWENASVFQTLDTAPFMGASVIEHGFAPEEDVAAILSRCSAVLFPSHAEGFGLPLAEALQMGVPVIASDLPSFREIAPEGPTYLPAGARDKWLAAILDHAASPRPAPEKLDFASWEWHFERLWKALDR